MKSFERLDETGRNGRGMYNLETRVITRRLVSSLNEDAEEPTEKVTVNF